MEPTAAPAEQDKPIDSPPSEEEAAPTDGPETGQPPEGEEESFYDFDPASIPEGTDPIEWVGEQHGLMRKAFTEKTMGLADIRRQAEQAQQVFEGLQDPEMAPHFLRLLGFDPTSQEFLDKFGLELEDEGGDGEPEELDLEDEVAALKEQLANRDEEAQRSQAEEQLEDFMAEQIESLESEFGREFNEAEIAFLRTHAERNPDPRGIPDLQGASKLLKGMLDQHFTAELEKRKHGNRPPGQGRPGGKAPDKSTPEGLHQAAKEAAEAEIASG